MRKYIVKIQDWVDDKLRQCCGRLSPNARVIVLVVLFLSFGIASICIFVSAIYNIGKKEGQLIEIQHIHQFELQRKDSINQLKFYDYGRDDQ